MMHYEVVPLAGVRITVDGMEIELYLPHNHASFEATFLLKPD